ncbi:hypothetical protein [Legionella saoudiensis]|uniref:hypothetical protein n=1 Tax=Legionella saoudiensis TaxID=1750561 RepID=UPI0007301699|nr:hypothetical protein [Legionella saoudiensis]
MKPNTSFFNLSPSGLFTHLKDNVYYIIVSLFVTLYFYGLHLDSKQQNPNDFISISEAWENLASGKFIHEMTNACSTARTEVLAYDKRST